MTAKKSRKDSPLRAVRQASLTKVLAEHPLHPGSRHDGRAAVAMAKNYADGEVIARHSHRRGQLIYAYSGPMAVSTESGAWVVPPQRALWMPPRIAHEIKVSGDLKMRTLYFEPNTPSELAFPRTCAVIEMTILMRDLVLRAVELEAAEYDHSQQFQNILDVLVDEAGKPPVTSFHLPMPYDQRLLRLCRALLANPAANLTLPMWGRRVGGSSRTLARHFLTETGITFAQWRQKARLLASLPKLARGESISSVALDLGYESPSAFSAMFRKTLGASPSSFVLGDERTISII